MTQTQGQIYRRKCKGCGKETNFMASFCPDCRKIIENTYKELMK